MWTLKLKVENSNFILGPKAKKYEVIIVGIPLMKFQNKDSFKLTIAGTIQENKESFIRDLKKDKSILRIDINNNFFIIEMKSNKFLDIINSEDVFYSNPMKILKNGWSYWEFSSWSKKSLEKIYTHSKENFKVQLLSLEKAYLPNINLLTSLPSLTEKQKNVLDLAIKNGYYEIPKRITLKQLANLANLSFTTFHSHLSKAERILMPFINELI